MRNQSNPEIYILAGKQYLEEIEYSPNGNEYLVNEKVLEEVARTFGLKPVFLKEYLNLSIQAKSTSDKIKAVDLLYEKFHKELDDYYCGYSTMSDLVRSCMQKSQEEVN